MAKTASKSQQIRQALQDNPGKKPGEVAEILKSKGVIVSNAYISVVKSSLKKKKGKRVKSVTRGRKVAAKGPAASSNFEAAANFVSSVGSFEEARQALERLQKLSQMVGGK